MSGVTRSKSKKSQLLSGLEDGDEAKMRKQKRLEKEQIAREKELDDLRLEVESLRNRITKEDDRDILKEQLLKLNSKFRKAKNHILANYKEMLEDIRDSYVREVEMNQNLQSKMEEIQNDNRQTGEWWKYEKERADSYEQKFIEANEKIDRLNRDLNECRENCNKIGESEERKPASVDKRPLNVDLFSEIVEGKKLKKTEKVQTKREDGNPLLAQIKKGVQLKKAEEPVEMEKEDDSNPLLAQIKKGIQLKKADRKEKKKDEQKEDENTLKNNALLRGVAARRKAMGEDDVEKDEEWNFGKRRVSRRKVSKKKSVSRRKVSKKKSVSRRKVSKKKSVSRRKVSKKKSVSRRKVSKKKSVSRRKVSKKKSVLRRKR